MVENTRSEARDRPKRTWMGRFGDALLVVAVAAAVYPWATGAYTYVEQQRMMRGFEKMAESVGGSESAEPTATGPRLFDTPAMQGWAAEDEAYWRSLQDGERFCRIVIPAMDLDAMVVKGVAKSDLKRGPGWLPGTALPGEIGNVGISGHRTTYLAPFRKLDDVEPGDRIELHSPYRVYVYEVERRFTVLPEEGHVMAPTEDAMLTLTTCHPPFSDDERMVVRARLVEVAIGEDTGDYQAE